MSDIQTYNIWWQHQASHRFKYNYMRLLEYTFWLESLVSIGMNGESGVSDYRHNRDQSFVTSLNVYVFAAFG